MGLFVVYEWVGEVHQITFNPERGTCVSILALGDTALNGSTLYFLNNFSFQNILVLIKICAQCFFSSQHFKKHRANRLAVS